MLSRKQKEKREEEEEELKKIKRAAEVWKYINKKRGKKTWGKNIEKATWKNYFKNLLEGTERKKEDKNKEENNIEDDSLEEEEIKITIKKLKGKKAAGIDGILMEAWKYAGETLWKKMVEMVKQIWREDTILEDWKKNVTVLLYKRSVKDNVGNYRGISLLCTAYKIYRNNKRKVRRGNV